MFDFLDLIGEWLTAWRLFACVALTGFVTYEIFKHVPNETVAWSVSVPVMIIGVVGGFWWQISSD